MIATFDHNDHAITPGWATYHRRTRGIAALVCRLLGHRYPTHVPQPPNGYSPSNHARCGRCGAWVHWYVEGQHRWGGMNREVWQACEFESIAQAYGSQGDKP